MGWHVLASLAFIAAHQYSILHLFHYYRTFDCAVKGYRQKEDPWNAIISGFLTGGCLAARGAWTVTAIPGDIADSDICRRTANDRLFGNCMRSTTGRYRGSRSIDAEGICRREPSCSADGAFSGPSLPYRWTTWLMGLCRSSLHQRQCRAIDALIFSFA